jgi:hypothetical protein
MIQARESYFVKSVILPQGPSFGHGLSMTKAEFHKLLLRGKISSGAQISVICMGKYLYDFHFKSRGGGYNC